MELDYIKNQTRKNKKEGLFLIRDNIILGCIAHNQHEMLS